MSSLIDTLSLQIYNTIDDICEFTSSKDELMPIMIEIAKYVMDDKRNCYHKIKNYMTNKTDLNEECLNTVTTAICKKFAVDNTTSLGVSRRRISIPVLTPCPQNIV